MDSQEEKYPKLHPNTVTEIESIDALRSALPVEKLLLRTEHRDFGIDLSLEVVDSTLVKNYRAQVQLKGTSSLEPDAGGIYSLSVETSNVNYLLNSPVSLYFLYIKSSNEFRFVWTWDERRRLERENTGWLDQETIVLRFDQVLTANAIDGIHSRIAAQGKSFRAINENLHLADSERVIFEMNRDTFDVTDTSAIESLLESKGVQLCVLGYSDFVLEKLALFPEEKRRTVSFMLTEAAAYLEKGQYQRAKESIAVLRSHNATILPSDRILSDYVKLICDMQTSAITFPYFVDELGKLVDQQGEPLPYDLRTHHAQLTVLLIDDEALRYSGTNEKERWRRLEAIRKSVELADQPRSQSSIGKRNQFALIKSESQIISIDCQNEIGAALLRLHKSGDVSEISTLAARQVSAFDQINLKLDKLAEDEDDAVFSADLVSFKAVIFFQYWVTFCFLSKHVADAPIFFSTVFIESLEASLSRAIAIYQRRQHLAPKLQTQISLAGLYFITGRKEDFSNLQKSIIREAEDFNLQGILVEAQNPLYIQIAELMARMPVPDSQADLTEEKISIYAQQQIDALQLPPERLENLKIGLRVGRDRAKEHREWCAFFDLAELVEQKSSSPTYYRHNPKKVVNCTKYGHISNIERSDWQLVMREFKDRYCSKCIDNPKLPRNEGG